MKQGEPSMQNKENLLKETSEAVAVLLKQYEHYLLLLTILKRGFDPRKTNTQKKFSFSRGPVQYLGEGEKLNPESRRAVERELEELGVAMKYQNPLIWLNYKYLAYKNQRSETGESLFIETLAKLIKHCSGGDICYRRFDAINLYLRRKHGGKDLTSAAFIDPATTLDVVGQDTRFIDMCLDPDFRAMWSAHENAASDKWQDYKLTNPDHDCEVNCTC